MRDDLTDLKLSRHPFQIYVLVLVLLVGFPLIFGDAKPNTIAALLSPSLENLWAVLLIGGAGTALAGIYWRDRATGFIMEQVGLIGVGFGCVVYCVALMVTSWPPAIVTTAIVGGFGFACCKRALQIERLVRRGINHG